MTRARRSPRAAAASRPGAGGDARAGAPRWRETAALFAALFLLRVAFICAGEDRDWPFSIFFYGDSGHFREWARAIAAGRLYNEGIPYHPPLFPVLLGGAWSLLGEPPNALAAKLLFAALNAGALTQLWAWTRRWLGAPWSGAAAAACGGAFGMLLFSANYCNEALALPLSIAVAQLAWRERAGLSRRGALWIGGLTGLSALARVEQLGWWPLLVGYAWLLRDPALDPRVFARRWALALAVCVAVIAPWTLRNWIRLDAWNRAHPEASLPRAVPVTLYGPISFALANHARAGGGFSSQVLQEFAAGRAGGLDVNDPAQRRLLLEGYAVGWRWIASDPRGALRLAGRKLSRALDGFRLGWGTAAFPGGLRGERPAVDLFIPDGALPLKWLCAALTLGGLLLSLTPGRREWLLPAGIVAHRLAVSVVFFGYARGLVLVLPFCVLLWLLPLRELSATRPAIARWTRRVVIGAAALLALQALFVTLSPPRRLMASGASDDQGKLIQDAPVTIWPAP